MCTCAEIQKIFGGAVASPAPPLGTALDDLSWSDHYSKISGKAYGKLALIRRTFSHHIPVHIKKSLYTALVKSQLLYGSQVWRPSLIRDIKSLERIQRRATKYILNDFTSNYKERLVALNLLPLMYVFELHDIMFFISNYKDPISPDRECFFLISKHKIWELQVGTI